MVENQYIRSNRIFSLLGSSNDRNNLRAENDFYATDPKALIELLKYENFNNVWECACGEGHLSNVLKEYKIHSKSSDLIDRGYGEIIDFLQIYEKWHGDIITNPPYKFVSEFIVKAINLIENGNKVAMLCRIQLLEGIGRYNQIFSKMPPTKIYIPVKRFHCAINGNFKKHRTNNAMMFAWFIWEKGNQSNTTIHFCNYN